jgi:hypothetical protein
MDMNAPPGIQSVASPPERYADRIIGEMTSWLQNEIRRHYPSVCAFLKHRDRPGSAKAQQRYLEQLGRTAGPMLLDAKLTAGTRGRYAVDLRLLSLTDDARQVIVTKVALVGDGGYGSHAEYRRLLFVSHHALVRMAMRIDVRTVADLRRTVTAMAKAFLVHEPSLEGRFPPEGKRFPFPGGIAVVQTASSLQRRVIVATVLEEKEEAVT